MSDIPKIIPRRDWVLILDCPRKIHTKGGILVPTTETGVEKISVGSGELVAIGPGTKNDALGLKVGDKAVYRSFLKHAHKIETDAKWSDGSPKIYFLMSSDDLLSVADPGLEVGVFSGKLE